MKKIDIHRAKGVRIEKAVKDALRKMGEYDAVRLFTGGITDSVARSERARARERRKKAEKYALNRDLFE